MNLLIEQRPPTLASSKSQTSSSSQQQQPPPPSQQQQQSQISNENDMNNSSSSSSLVLKIKRHSTKQHQQQQTNDLHSNLSHMSEEDNHNNNSHSFSTAPRLKRTSISNTIATRRPSSPAFNGKQQQNTTKRSFTTDNNNNDLTSNLDETSSTKRFKREDLNQLSRKVDACVETVSVGLATEPDQLGPCEPGTSVVLEGIVWNETDSGVLVVNVTWRGKTYVGTLLDSTKQDWACPRLTCESPTSDYDARGGNKASRTKRTGAGGNTRASTQQNISLCQQVTSNNHLAGLDERRLRNNIKSRQSKRLSNLVNTNDETSANSPPPRTTNQTFFSSDTSSTSSSTTSEPQLISCIEPQCHKRFTSTTALGYHLSNAHRQTESSSVSTSNTVPQASTRDEEDVAHILANVADYVRRSSPPSSIRCSPERQHSPSTTAAAAIKSLENSPTLTWPCPQISSKLVLSSSLNQVLSPDSTNRCKLNNNECNASEQDDLKSSVKPADHFLLHIQDEPIVKKSTTISSANYQDLNNSKKPSPPLLPTASSPAYSDISDEEPTTTTTESVSHPSSSTSSILPPSTINLLTATNGKIDENGNNLHSSSSSMSTNTDLTNPAWTAQMLLQQFGPFIQQQQTLVTDISSTPNRLNSNNTCPSTNGTSDSTVKNILDARRSSTTKSSSSPTTLYPFHPNESKFPTPIINTLTSPNENLLHLSTSTIKPMDVIDYSLTNTRSSNAGQYHHSSSLHPSR